MEADRELRDENDELAAVGAMMSELLSRGMERFDLREFPSDSVPLGFRD
jgi:hypothetical protein